MSNLVEVRNNQVVVSSRQVAKRFSKEHKNVLVSIREILSAEKSADKFYELISYKYRGRELPEYYMNREGFALLVMGFTGKIALQWKVKYINAFNEMEAELLKPKLKSANEADLHIDPNNEEFKAILNDALEKISTLKNLISAWKCTYRKVDENEIYKKIVLEHAHRIFSKLFEVDKITFKTGTLEELKFGHKS